MHKSISETPEEIVLGQIFFIFVLPVLLLYFNIIDKEWRVMVLIVACLLIYGILKKGKWDNSTWGLRFDNFHKSLIPYLCATLLSSVFIIWFAGKLDMKVESYWWLDRHFWFIFILVSFLQEFAYRGFLIPLMERIFTDRLGIILINALLFTLLHIIYPIPQIMIPFAFMGGLVFAYMYLRYPNIILISMMHTVMNFIAVLYGFFVIYH